jgi:hypothetical protein
MADTTFDEARQRLIDSLNKARTAKPVKRSPARPPTSGKPSAKAKANVKASPRTKATKKA